MLSIKQKTDESGLWELLKPSLLGSLAGIITSAAMALILPLVLVKLKDPDSLIAPLAIVSLYTGAFVCGAAVRRYGALSALISGGGFVLCMWLLSLTQGNGEPLGFALKLLGYICCIAVSLLGAVVLKRKQSRVGEGKKSPTARLRKQLGKRQ